MPHTRHGRFFFSMASLVPLDVAAFRSALEAARPGKTLEPFRNALREGSGQLARRFEQGIPIAELVASRAALVDELIQAAWRLWMPAASHECCTCIAVGGYGRGELHPHSDVDILILLEESPGGRIREHLEHLITHLWDMKLEVGHSVRTVEDCVFEAERDITVITNLQEIRRVAGSTRLMVALKQAIGPDRLWSPADFLDAKREEQRLRHSRMGDSLNRLEPNLKESPGGLRDIQTIAWVAQRLIGAETLHALVKNGFLTDSEYRTLSEGEQHLWRIRFALHQLAGRREDRLLFDYQRTLAAQFGFEDTADSLAVEQFMQGYYRTLTEIARLNEMLLQLFEEAIQVHIPPAIPVNRRFQSRHGYLEAIDERVFEHYPWALLEVFLLLAIHPDLVGVRAGTIRLIRDHRHRIDDSFRRDIKARTLFMEILRQPHQCITQTLRRMNRYGILAAYLPAFANIVGRMQYDLFHVFTVDEHTLFVIRNLRGFMSPDLAHEHPLCGVVVKNIPKMELLYLAALFHDIAKGRGGDHSLLGAQDALVFCRNHNLSDFDGRLVTWLVEKHLLMSMTVQRKDISDAEVIQTFAAQVGDMSRLDYLFLLTVADSHATNPARWNSWRASLLNELYLTTHRALLRGLDNPQAQDEMLAERRHEVSRLLKTHGVPIASCEALWVTLGPDFLLHGTPEEIAWQTHLMIQSPPQGTVSNLMPLTTHGCSALFVFAPERPGRFAQITAFLDQVGLTILDARLHVTEDRRACHAYWVLEQDGTPLAPGHRQQEVREGLAALLVAPTGRPPPLPRRPSRQQRLFHIPPRVEFGEDLRGRFTVVHLVAADRPGLLADVGLAFQDVGVDLHKAKISTIGAEVEDLFFITGSQRQPLDRPEDFAALRERLMARLTAAG
ncbi:MAG: [protein-PII] uridylyltransferase [Pseudomonadota bacterium]